LFGIKFGTTDYQFSRTNFNDRLGLAQPRDKYGSRKVRLPNPEFGFHYGEIDCTESGTVYRVCAKMTMKAKDGVSSASKSEVCAAMRKIADEYAKRYGLEFATFKSPVDPERFCDTYRFMQGDRFIFLICGDMRPAKNSPPIIKVEANHYGGPRILDYSKSRLGRTWREESDYEQNLVISNFMGFSFGELCSSAAGHTITQQLSRAQGVFEFVQLSYNATGCLYRITAEVRRDDYAKKNGCSKDEAGEVLHREIVRVVREIEDQYKISCLAREIGDELTEENNYEVSNLWPWKIKGGVSWWYNRDAKMSARTSEDLSQISITLTNNFLSKKVPSNCAPQRRSSGLLQRRALPK